MTERAPRNNKEQDKKLKKVLITGANGIIGSLLTKSLAKKFDIVGLDVAGKADNETTFIADISDIEALDAAFRIMGHIDSIVHLAANADDKASWEDVLRNNIIGTRNIYDCAQRHGVKRVIFASSTHLFGAYPQYPDKPTGTPISVNAQHRPDSYYGISKGFGEDLARYYYDTYGIQTISIRIGSVSKDNAPVKPYHLLWLSHRDVTQVFERALVSKIKFGAYFAISVESTIFDIEPTKRALRFHPRDTKLPDA